MTCMSTVETPIHYHPCRLYVQQFCANPAVHDYPKQNDLLSVQLMTVLMTDYTILLRWSLPSTTCKPGQAKLQRACHASVCFAVMFHSSTHGVAWLVQVDDCGLVPDHHGQTVDDSLAANTAVSEALEGEVVRATCWCCIHLHCACLHGITDTDGCVDVLSEQAALHDTHIYAMLRQAEHRQTGLDMAAMFQDLLKQIHPLIATCGDKYLRSLQTVSADTSTKL